jgi:hypothetical protein
MVLRNQLYIKSEISGIANLVFIARCPALVILTYAHHHDGCAEKCLFAKTDEYVVLFHRPDRTQEAE